ncbi:hypothetical protein CI630_20820 [Enterobacter hormaechei subsp. steigerwaltii]|nr:hypothetical protein CI630_20820 [Enterobacter hormaechei subsp. steigerwaltii]
MMSLWDALRMNMMISYQELVRTFPISRLCIINQKFRLNSRHRYMNKLRLMLSVITLNQSRSLRFVRLMRITENVRTLLF